MSYNRRGMRRKGSNTPDGILANVFDELLETDRLIGLVKTKIDQTAERMKLAGPEKSRFKSNLSTHMNSSKMSIKTFIVLLKDVLLVESLNIYMVIEYMDGRISKYDKLNTLNPKRDVVKELEEKKSGKKKTKVLKETSDATRAKTAEGILANLFATIRKEDGFEENTNARLNSAADKFGLKGLPRAKYKSNIKTHMNSKKMSIKIFMSLLKDYLDVRKLDVVFSVKYSNGIVSNYDRELVLNTTPSKDKDKNEK